MPGLGNLILRIEQVVGLVQLGIGTFQAYKAAVTAGKAAITEQNGEVIPPEQLDARYEAVLAHAGQVGDHAGDRVEDRIGDGTGEP